MYVLNKYTTRQLEILLYAHGLFFSSFKKHRKEKTRIKNIIRYKKVMLVKNYY